MTKEKAGNEGVVKNDQDLGAKTQNKTKQKCKPDFTA